MLSMTASLVSDFILRCYVVSRLVYLERPFLDEYLSKVLVRFALPTDVITKALSCLWYSAPQQLHFQAMSHHMSGLGSEMASFGTRHHGRHTNKQDPENSRKYCINYHLYLCRT
jgi:hypothetical protein